MLKKSLELPLRDAAEDAAKDADKSIINTVARGGKISMLRFSLVSAHLLSLLFQQMELWQTTVLNQSCSSSLSPNPESTILILLKVRSARSYKQMY